MKINLNGIIASSFLTLFFCSAALSFAAKTITPSSLSKVSLCLGWFLNPNYAAILIGMEKGFFQEEGLEIVLIAAANPDEGCKLVAAQGADIAFASLPRLFFMAAKGLPLVRFATLVDHPLSVIISRLPLTEHSDWKGKRIGCSGSESSLGPLVLQQILRQNNLHAQDVSVIIVHRALATAFLSGQIDIILNAYQTYELADIKNHKFQVYTYPYTDFGVPSYEELILVTHQKSLERPEIKKFIRALDKSLLHLKQEKKDVLWKLLTKRYPELDSSLNRRIFEEILPHFSQKSSLFNQEVYQKFRDFFEAKKQLSLPPVSSVAVEITP